jgi:hypothetical protein
MLAGGTTHAQLVDCLVRNFGISADQAAGDVDAFVRDLEARELLNK